LGHPWLKTNLWGKASTIFLVELSGRSVNSHHRAKYFVMTKKYLLPLSEVGEVGKGPMRFHPTSSKGVETTIGDSVLALWLDDLLD
jgi:hypothetical protein